MANYGNDVFLARIERHARSQEAAQDLRQRWAQTFSRLERLEQALVRVTIDLGEANKLIAVQGARIRELEGMRPLYEARHSL